MQPNTGNETQSTRLEFILDSSNVVYSMVQIDSLAVSSMDTAQQSGRIILGRGYPNPFSPTTFIVFEARLAGDVVIDLFNVKGDLLGREIYLDLLPGNYEVFMNNKIFSLESGIYLYRISMNGQKPIVKKMMLIK